MKTTALIIATFFLVLSGSMKIVKSDLTPESEFYSFNSSVNDRDLLTDKVKGISANHSFKPGNASSESLNLESTMFSEKELTIEDWMTEINEFYTESSLFIEDEIQIEEWMTEFYTVDKNDFAYTDSEILIEEWMTSNFNHSAGSNFFMEQDLTLEDWMTEPHDWVEKK